MSDQPILQIQDLCKDFKVRSSKLFEKSKQLHALSHVSLDIQQGETLGIIGESGCGKSTLGRCVVGLHSITSGDIFYKGQNLKELHTKEERKSRHKNIQIVFQDPYSSLNPRMTCGQLIEEGLIVHNLEPDKKKRRERVFEMMQKVGLDVQHIERFPHEFSGGQRQRINVARALILNPDIIVCDEPVSALDVSIQAQVLNLFRSIQKEFNLTYIFISHDLSVIKHVSDRIAIMYLGTVVELCAAEKIYSNPLHPYTKALLSAIPPDSPFEVREQIKLEGDIPSPIGDMKGCPLAGRCPYATARCQEERPQLKEVDPGHQVACFLME